MSAYKLPIATAFIFFPIIAFIFTLPFLIYQYRKYGSIPFLRSVIFYSFILYLLCAYFLVILPLPTIDEVKNLTTETTQLVPFDFIRQLSNTISFQWNELSSYLTVIKSPAFYIAAFNILLTLPFGVYLRYYFECKWYKIILYGFLLSLFFELTQLTGLYGIYPRPYRLFDVDDLILNTTGALIGCLLTPLISKILPSRKELDEHSFRRGKKVTLFRRALSYCIDFFFLVTMVMVVSILSYNTEVSKYSMLLSIILYYIGIPLFTNGKKKKKMILKLQVTSKNETSNIKNKVKVTLRYLLSYVLFYYQFLIIEWIRNISVDNDFTSIIKNSSILILKIYFWLNIIWIIKSLVTKDKRFLYEKITGTENISTIDYEIKSDNELEINQKNSNHKENKKEDEDVRNKKDK